MTWVYPLDTVAVSSCNTPNSVAFLNENGDKIVCERSHSSCVSLEMDFIQYEIL